MKKSLLAVLIAGTMTISAVPGAVWAGEKESEEDSLGSMLTSILGKAGEIGSELEETGLVDQILGKDGPLGAFLPEGVDASELFGTVTQQLNDSDSELYQGLEGLESLAGMVIGEDGSVDTQMIEGLIGSFFGDASSSDMESVDEGEEDGDEDEEEAADFFDVYSDEAYEAIDQHLMEETSEYMEEGDETIISKTIAWAETDEDGTIYILGYFLVTNYDADGKDLVMKNAAGNTEFLKLTLNEKGTLDVTDFQVSEDGTGYLESVEAMCETAGITTDEFFNALSFSDGTDIAEMINFLDNHPEYERIEFQGEARTKKELEDKLGELFIQLFSVDEEESTEA